MFDANKYLNQHIVSMPPSGIRKFFDLAAECPEAISLSVGEPDFVTPRKIRDAAIAAINAGKTAYSANAGFIELRQEISKYLSRSFNVEFDPYKEIVVTCGGSEAIDITLTALLQEGDEILIPEPCFVSYAPCAELAGGKVVPVPTYMENNFKLDVDVLEKYVTPATKALLFNYPSNPTGVIMTKEDLQKVAEFVIKHDLIVISDEIYAELTYTGRHCSIASLPGMRDRTILISGFSKAFAMTGWRIGYVCANEGLIQTIVKCHQYKIMCAPSIGQFAAIEALKHGEDDMKAMIDEYHRRRDYIVPRFRSMGLDIAEPQGAFYAFPSIKKSGLSSEEFCERLLKEKDVAIVPGSAFGACGEGFVRCSYATSMEKIKTALDRLEEFMQQF